MTSKCKHESYLAFSCPRFQSCIFQEEPRVITGGRAHVLCGILDSTSAQGKVAVKAFWRIDEEEELAIENELRIWSMLCINTHVASFLGIAPINKYDSTYFPKGLVSDYYADGNLNEFLRETDPDIKERLELIVGVIRGVEHMHAQAVVHGDLKADNVLVDSRKNIVKICDFGSSSIKCGCYNGPKDQTGTTPWDSPELWQLEPITTRSFKSDVWAFGCVALEVQMDMRPWDPDGEGDMYEMRWRQIEAKGGYPAQESDLNLGDDPIETRVWELMQLCWRKTPDERPTAIELKRDFEDLLTQEGWNSSILYVQESS